MEEKYADLEVVWLVTDVRKMDLPDYSFDVAIDKVCSAVQSLRLEIADFMGRAPWMP